MSDPLQPSFQPPPPPQHPPFQPPPAPQAPFETVPARPTQLRPFAIGFFLLGLIVLVLGIVKVVNIDIWTAVALALTGIALFGLSFIRLPRVPDTEPPLSPVQKLTGIFYEPTRVFRNLRVHPRWVAAFLVVAILSIIYSIAFVRRVTPERIVNHTIDKMAEMGPPFAPPAEMLEDMRAKQLDQLKSPTQRVGTAIKTFCGLLLWGAAMAALFLLAGMAFGGRINFWQAKSVYFYASVPIIVIQKVLSLVILYIKDPDDVHPLLGQDNLVQDNLGILFTPASNPVLFVMASFIGVLSFYGLWLRAKGLNQAATKMSSGAAWGVAITFWVLTLLFVTIITALFPGFIS